ncbi:hypothetical protein ACFYW6_17800 [Streptomyces sp. NPDC002659]|uniref:MmyB family transcriptional regulator n=1 Tax=Streptomyces sp. NPDC002659 TaxID=3364656 RepID=UPI0036853834
MSEVSARQAQAGTGGFAHARDEMIRQLVEREQRRLGLAKKDLAAVLAITPRQLRNWMAAPSNLALGQVEKLAHALEMSTSSLANLYVLRGLMPPAPPVEELMRTPEMALYKRMIDGLEHPSVVHDYAWDVVLYNKEFQDLFGRVSPHESAHPTRNPMRYVLLHPDAPLILGGGNSEVYREMWLMPSLANLAATLQQQSADERLLAIERDINSRPDLRRAYRDAPRWIVEHSDIPVNADPRPIRDPRTGEMASVQIVIEAHQSYQAMTLQRSTMILA